jgi:prepilin-type N-terminal cleavage/methylation domain-containing protein
MSRRASQGGFSLLELMIVLTILGVLARLSIPVYQSVRRDALAARAAGDFNTVRAAAIAQYEATGDYPADGPAGVTPAGMSPFLPSAFRFTKPEYQLDWEHWTVPDSSSGGGAAGEVVALTILTPDERLTRQLIRTLGRNCTHWSVDDASTFVVMSSLEAGR